jgi:hypothetical protein
MEQQVEVLMAVVAQLQREVSAQQQLIDALVASGLSTASGLWVPSWRV